MLVQMKDSMSIGLQLALVRPSQFEPSCLGWHRFRQTDLQQEVPGIIAGRQRAGVLISAHFETHAFQNGLRAEIYLSHA